MGPKKTRRQVLTTSLAMAGTLLAAPAIVRAHNAVREIRFHHLHTGESLKAAYWAEGTYLPEGLSAIDTILRDFRSGEVSPIDPKLIDQLHRLVERVGSPQAFHIISGYRSPKTNAMLRKTGSGGVAKRSLHMRGKAIDVSLPGVELRRLHRAALSLKAGGVGYYPKSGFVHLDTGRVRSW